MKEERKRQQKAVQDVINGAQVGTSKALSFHIDEVPILKSS